MPIRPATTILLLTRQSLVRADLSAGPKAGVVDYWTQSRPDLPDLPSLVESALVLGPTPGKQVWVLTTDLWTQTLEVPLQKTVGASAADLAAALNFEAEALSGVSAFEGAVGQVPLDRHDGQQRFWIVQARTADLQLIDDLVRKSGSRFMGVAHPGGLPRALSNELESTVAWQRVELWPDAVVALSGVGPGPVSVQVFNTDPPLGRWRRDVTQWEGGRDAVDSREVLVGPGVVYAVEEPETARITRMDDAAQQNAWLLAVRDRLALKQPGWPLVRPAPLPMSVGTRRAVSLILALLVAATCYGVQTWMTRAVAAANAERAILDQPRARLAELQKQMKETEGKRDAAAKEAGDLQRAAVRLAGQRDRLVHLLICLAEQRTEHLLVQKIETNSGEPHIYGVCLEPELADQFARQLAEKLGAEWEVLTPKKQAKKFVDSGAPWAFEIPLKFVPEPKDVKPAVPLDGDNPMNLTARDKLLAMFLPSIMVLAAYGWFWFIPTQTAWTQAGKALDASRTANPGLKNQVLQAQGQLALANLDLQKRDGEKKAAHQAWDVAAGRCHDAHLRNDRIEKLNSLLAHRNLQLLEDSEADSSKEGKVAPGLEGLALQMGTLAAAPKPQTRKIRMVGRYVDVVAALEDLSAGEVLAIPIGLSMKQAPLTGGLREWTLIVWI